MFEFSELEGIDEPAFVDGPGQAVSLLLRRERIVRRLAPALGSAATPARSLRIAAADGLGAHR